jgi:predicted nucleic acid-binding protein
MSPFGHCRRLADRAIDGDFTLVVCPELAAEYEEVLARPGIERHVARSRTPVAGFMGELLQVADPSNSQLVQGIVAGDRDDDIVIGCALGGRAGYIVSGDHHLLDLREYRGVQVLRQQEMLLLLDALH